MRVWDEEEEGIEIVKRRETRGVFDGNMHASRYDSDMKRPEPATAPCLGSQQKRRSTIG